MIQRRCDLCKQVIPDGEFIGEIRFTIRETACEKTDYQTEKRVWKSKQITLSDICHKDYMNLRVVMDGLTEEL